MFKINKVQKGQISLIVLTVMAVALTLGLSMSRRSVTDVSISEKEQESAKAFSAAEAGIEEALRQLNQGSTTVDIQGSDLGVGNVDVDITELGGSDSYVYPQEYVRSGESAIIWLVNHNSDGTVDLSTEGYTGSDIEVCWGNNAALEVTYFYQSGGSYDIQRWTFDNDTDRRLNNNFTDPTGSGCSTTDSDLTVSHNVSLQGTPLFLVLKPFYYQTPLGVEGDTLPSQGYEIYSTAQVEESSEDENISRRIRVFRGWDILPDSLFNVLFSGTGIVTN
jgi:hypothetical protein